MSNKYEKTYCNPISLPDYAFAGKDWGFFGAFLPVTGRWQEGNEAKFNNPIRSYRTASDPDIMFYEGKWYMYGSMDCCYVSSDLLNWECHAVLPRRYNPAGETRNGKSLSPLDKELFSIEVGVTAVPFNGRIYLAHSTTNCIYSSASPFGPFEKVGNFRRPSGGELWVDDPCLFEDEGRLYMYFGCGVESGIQGVELDPDDPSKLLCEPVRIVEFRSETGWECTGARYQFKDVGWIEGCDMFKHNGRYYLTYAANGTTYDTYNLGYYYSDESPLSGFRPMENGPFCEKKSGICKGAGHGCVIKGPNDGIWVFYTSATASTTHMYERRIGMDKVVVDEKGRLTVITTDTPQWAPGVIPADRGDNGAGIYPVNHQNPAWATSAQPGRDPIYVTDESMLTWWMPDEGDSKRQLIVDFRADYDVSACRILWKELGLDEDEGRLPGAVQYTVEITDNPNGGEWEMLLDMSENSVDYLNDYRTFETKRGRAARLTITGKPNGIDIGVVSFILFGNR